MTIVFWFLKKLSHAAQKRLGAGVGWFIFAVLRIRRGVVDRQLQMAFPAWDKKKRKQIALGAYRAMATTASEGGLMARISQEGPLNALPPWFSQEGFAHIEAALQGGKGAIIVTAHLGNFDLMGTIYALLGVKLNIVARDIKNKRLNALWVKLRESSGLKQISAHRRKGALKHILTALKNNEVVGLVLDQNMRADMGVFVDFFGKKACTLDLAAVLAKRTGAPVIPAFMLRTASGDHHAKIFAPLQWIAGDDDIVVNTQLYTRIIEDMIRAYPEQWLWLHRRWKTQPSMA